MKTAFDVQGNWYKGVTHCHSTRSDGTKTPEQIMNWYKEHGYHFAALTDHLVCTDTRHLSTPNFLTIPGIEVHGKDMSIGRTPHIVGLGSGMVGSVAEGTSLQEMIDTFTGCGMLAIIAHPYWSSLRDEHLSVATNYVAIEIYNQTCWEDCGKSDSLTYWDNLLFDGRRVWGLAVDDAHCYDGKPDIGSGWIVARAAELTEPAILEAVRAGYFYASQGPAIEDWQINGQEVYVRCSPVECIQIHDENGRGKVIRAPEGETITEATLKIKEIRRYLRATCIDAQHRRAWTNPVFAGE